MADPQSVVALIDSASSKIQQLQQAFTELESHSSISLNLKWKELETHFRGLENSMKKRFDDLEVQENEYTTKVMEARDMLEKREAAVVTKELASLDRLQEKRDAALYAIFKMEKICPSQPISNELNTDISDSVSEKNCNVISDESDIEQNRPAANGNVETKPQSELMKLCEDMNAAGLHKFISDNRKNLSSIREEIPVALRSASNPFILVLNSLEDFYSGDILGSDGKKDGSLLGLRRTCLMLMESLELMVTDDLSGPLSDNQMLTSDIKHKAKAIARQWKPKLADLDVDSSSGNSLEAHAFLQLLATFGIACEFDLEEICKLIPAVTRRRQAVDLCRSLGLSEKMPGLIEVLLNSGRQIEAVNLAFAFELTEKFTPVPLLKAYLKEVKKVSQVKTGSMSPGAQNEANERELSALKTVIKCIEEHKLEEQYPLDPLQKRIFQLEKAKADKRRAAEAAKPQCKRPRASGTIYSSRVTGIPEKSFYRAPHERYPYPYDRQYVYPAETPHPQLLAPAPAPYSISPTHAPYYGNAYQMQYQTAYLH